ncbi:hypothetical protein Pa4123_39420 [Phytohabitans aurantiacus]|uniref:Uncharacterized protein n=1 Tax=Phytohabitans aurantiacus TaxID=3016789 RepID=A0ABQ5QXL9_9ACTN|nr:hypothetical protein Pa4123_39420 [Phytohabitans aurantiacus]
MVVTAVATGVPGVGSGVAACAGAATTSAHDTAVPRMANLRIMETIIDAPRWAKGREVMLAPSVPRRSRY